MINQMFTRGSFLAAASAFAASLPAVDAQRSERRFAADVVRGDLDAIWSALLDVGAEPFRSSQRSIVEKRYRAARAGISSAMTVREAWLAIVPVLGALNDGHVGLGFPDPLNAAPRRFPLRFALSDEDDSLIVATDRTNRIPIGSRIMSVEGVSAKRYRSVTLEAFGGQTRALHRSRLTTSGRWSAVALFGDRPSYRVRWITPGGVPGDGDIAGGSAAAASAAEPYTYKTLQHGTVGYIDYRSCEDLPRFKRFLNATFRGIQAAPMGALIIDIRRNGGGDSDLNDVLWTYVSSKPFKQFGEVIEKACDRLKRQYGREQYIAVYGDSAWRAPDGTILRSGMDPNANLIVPGPLAVRFTGPVYLLISARTFSSAMSCADAAKDYSLATIVGEETGEPVNSTGEVYTETAPGIGLRAYLTTKVFLSPKPHPDGQGVVPDIAVTTTPADIAARRDPVLDRVFAKISERSS